ncbi:MAG: hypothetical protein ACKO7R_06445 [Pseudanabaena sp.]
MIKRQQTPLDDFYDRIRDILTSTKTGIARTVNTAQVLMRSPKMRSPKI